MIFPPLPTIEQRTMALAALNGAVTRHTRQRSVQSMVGRGLARLQEAQPEGLLTRGLLAVKPVIALGAFPRLMLTNALGLLVVSFSYYISDLGYGNYALEGFFLLGLLLMYVPNLVRFLSSAPSRLERIYSLCTLGSCFYLVEFMVSPLHYSSFDDFLHWRTASDILRTAHLFSPNSMLPVSPYYPGLEIVTNAVGTMTGLSTFYAGVLVINTARLLMILSLFLLFEQITNSSRIAGIGVLIYMANPHFLFFDAIYNYETLALPFATFMLYILARYNIVDKDHRLVVFMAWIVLAAVTITHHMTDYTLIGLLTLWAVVNVFRPASRQSRVRLVALALFGLALALAYAFLLPGNPVWKYLSSYFAGAFSELQHIVKGTGPARSLFTSAAQPSPLWDRVLITGSVALITLSLPFGLFNLWGHYRHNDLAVTLGIFSLSYPATQVFRFTQYGSEITDRAAAFLFLAIACIFAILIAHVWPTRKLNRRVISLITLALALVFLGGVLVALGADYTDLPGPYLVSADMRSIEPEGIQAATWSLAYLGPNNRIGTDRINQMLMSTYGDQRVVTRLYDNVDISPIFYASQLSPDEVRLLRYAGLSYLVVDMRLSQSLPLVGLYFENDSPTKPMNKEALTKFDTVSKLNRIFDSGNLVIYDAGAYFNGSG